MIKLLRVCVPRMERKEYRELENILNLRGVNEALYTVLLYIHPWVRVPKTNKSLIAKCLA